MFQKGEHVLPGEVGGVGHGRGGEGAKSLRVVVEKAIHYVRVALREDACRVSMGSLPRVPTALAYFALTIIYHGMKRLYHDGAKAVAQMLDWQLGTRL